jgi:hypothetical protein
MKNIILPLLLLLPMVFVPITTVNAQEKVNFAGVSDHYAERGQQVTLMGSLTAYEMCDISLKLWLNDFSKTWAYVFKTPTTITIGQASSVNITLTIPEDAEEGTYVQLLQGFVDGEYDFSWSINVNVGHPGLLPSACVQEDHWYENRWIAYENVPRDVYGPNQVGMIISYGLACMFEQNIEVNYDWEGIGGQMGEFHVWTQIGQVTMHSAPCRMSKDCAAGDYIFHISVNYHNYTRLDTLDIPVTVHCVGEGNPTAEKTIETHARMIGDTNFDGVIDMEDISYVATRFGIIGSDPLSDPNVDINNDGKIDMRDIGYVARHFLETT